MKILIGYDGSESADVGIEGLRRAGLPPRDVEALVVTVAEVWLPPPPGDEVLDDTFPLQIPEGVKRMRERAARLVGQAEALAERGAECVRRVFPQIGELRFEALQLVQISLNALPSCAIRSGRGLLRLRDTQP